jgi:beta-galactosidase
LNCKRYVYIVLIFLILGALPIIAQTRVTVERDFDNGWQLMVDGEPLVVHGIVWTFVPIGENYSYILWNQSDEYIRTLIDTDAELLKAMGVNVIRVFSDVPPQWVQYLYQRHGIYTVVNDLFGRYGMTVDGRWLGRTDYSDMRTRELILDQVRATAERYKGVPGVLFYLLGNENNYGLEWDSDAIEDLPVGQRLEVRAGYLYSLFEEGVRTVKDVDPFKPVGIVNGDIQYLNIIKELVPTMDLIGINTYRGERAEDLFYSSIANSLDIPLVFTELGADAFNIRTGREDQLSQAMFIHSQWQEIYQQSYGKGLSQNVLGGFVFEWIDEWWKSGMVEGLDEHDMTGTWANGAYWTDAVQNENNMNEEWFGIAYQSPLTEDGINKRRLRAAHYVLQQAWVLDQYSSTAEEVEEHFAGIDVEMIALRTELDSMATELQEEPVVSMSGSLNILSRAEFDNLSIGAGFKQGLTISNGQWLYLTTDLAPIEDLTASVTLRIQGEVADSPLFQEEFSRFEYLEIDSTVVTDANGDPATLTSISGQPVEIYQAEFSYSTDAVDIDGYYHNGHGAWLGEGDYFGLLPESFDFLGMDLEGSNAPVGIEINPKGLLENLKIYGGPEPYWGAAPQIFVKWYQPGELFTWGAIWNETFSMEDPSLASGGYSRRASLYGSVDLLPYIQVDFGLLHSGSEKIGVLYDDVAADGTVTTNRQIGLADTFAGRIDLASTLFFYTTLRASYTYAGLVATSNGMIIRNGSQLGQDGSANKHEIDASAELVIGPFGITPKIRYRLPLSHPLPVVNFGPRKPLEDPFTVWSNREAIQAELILTYDPKGDTYFFDWNADEREHAGLAASLSFLYNPYLGPTDANSYFMADGTPASFTTGLPAVQNTWSAVARVVSNPLPDLRGVFTFRTGLGQSTGEDPDLINYYAGSAEVRLRQWIAGLYLSFNDWGPADWYRNFNITYPWQWTVDLARGFSVPTFMGMENRFGINWSGKQFDSADPDADGRTWQSTISAYFNLTW